MIDMHSPLETVPVDGGKPLNVEPNRRWWPNPVSMEFCAAIRRPGSDRGEEHWYDEEGQPLDAGSPAIRNARRITAADLRDAFFAGAGIAEGGKEETERRYRLWLERRAA